MIQPESLFGQLANLCESKKHRCSPCQSSKNKVDAETFLWTNVWPGVSLIFFFGFPRLTRKWLYKLYVEKKALDFFLRPFFETHPYFSSQRKEINRKVFFKKCFIPNGWTYNWNNIVPICRSLNFFSHVHLSLRIPKDPPMEGFERTRMTQGCFEVLKIGTGLRGQDT